MEQLKVTVITACYNAANEIEDTIKSVLSQTYDSIEYIIIDGGSKDGTMDIIEKYSNRIDHIVSESDNGIYDAMNKGVELASGSYMIFMNAGDIFASRSTLKDCSAYFNEDADFYYGDCICKHKYGNIYAKAAGLRHLLKEMCFSHQSLLVSSILMKEYRYDVKYKLAADYKLILSGYLNNKQFRYINLAISIVEKDSGATAANFIKSKKEVRSIHKEAGFSFVYREYVFLTLLLKGYLYTALKTILPSKIIQVLKKSFSDDYKK